MDSWDGVGTLKMVQAPPAGACPEGDSWLVNCGATLSVTVTSNTITAGQPGALGNGGLGTSMASQQIAAAAGGSAGLGSSFTPASLSAPATMVVPGTGANGYINPGAAGGAFPMAPASSPIPIVPVAQPAAAPIPIVPTLTPAAVPAPIVPAVTPAAATLPVPTPTTTGATTGAATTPGALTLPGAAAAAGGAGASTGPAATPTSSVATSIPTTANAATATPVTASGGTATPTTATAAAAPATAPAPAQMLVSGRRLVQADINVDLTQAVPMKAGVACSQPIQGVATGANSAVIAVPGGIIGSAKVLANNLIVLIDGASNSQCAATYQLQPGGVFLQAGRNLTAIAEAKNASIIAAAKAAAEAVAPAAAGSVRAGMAGTAAAAAAALVLGAALLQLLG